MAWVIYPRSQAIVYSKMGKTTEILRYILCVLLVILAKMIHVFLNAIFSKYITKAQFV